MDWLHKSNRNLLHFICQPLVKQKAILEYFYLIFHFFSIYYQRKSSKRKKERKENHSHECLPIPYKCTMK